MTDPTPSQAQLDYDAAARRLDEASKQAAVYGIGIDVAGAAIAKLMQHVIGPEGSDAWLEWHADLFDRIVENLPAVIENAKAEQARAQLLAATDVRHLGLVQP